MIGTARGRNRRNFRTKALATLAPILTLACGQATEPPREPAPGAEGRQEIALSDEALSAARIETVMVSREAFHPHLVASGVIRPNALKSVTVRARVAGQVIRVHADVGDRVTAGRSLAAIESPEMTAASARHRMAVAHEAAARKSWERAKRLLEMKALSAAEVEAREAEAEAAAAELNAARQDLTRLGYRAGDAEPGAGELSSEYEVTTPLGGTVLERRVSTGQLVERDATLFTVADLSKVWVVADVYEKDLGQLREHGDVEIRTDAFPGEVFSGRIALVEPALDEASRTAHVRVVLDNPSRKFRPGLFVTVAIPLRGASETEATAVPAEALQKFSGLPAVFVEKAPGRFELRPVETGREAHGLVEILHGLGDGEKVVARGAFILKSELLKGTIEGEDH